MSTEPQSIKGFNDLITLGRLLVRCDLPKVCIQLSFLLRVVYAHRAGYDASGGMFQPFLPKTAPFIRFPLRR